MSAWEDHAYMEAHESAREPARLRSALGCRVLVAGTRGLN
jgi:hypothetical protein